MIYPLIGHSLITFMYLNHSYKTPRLKKIIQAFVRTILVGGLAASVSLLLSNFWGYYLSKELLFSLNWFYPYKENLMLTVIVCILVFQMLIIINYWVKNQIIIRRQERLTWVNIVSQSIATLFFFIGIAIAYSGRWLILNFGGVSIDQVVYAITQPIAGTDINQIKSFIRLALVPIVSIVYVSIFVIGFANSYQIPKSKKIHWPKASRSVVLYSARILLGLAVLATGIFYSVSKLGYEDVKAYFFEKSSIFEDYYIDPKEVSLTFPAQKKNLIYIYLESVETTYLSKELGGQQEKNLMPNLTHLAETEGINFSNTDKLGGALPVPGTGYTVAGMVAQSAGIPILGDGNAYGETEDYIPGAYSIGEILKNEGYSNTLMIGSDASFAGRDKFFNQHGNFNILDYNHAIFNGLIPSDYKVWWGYEDEKLFDFSKLALNDLGEKEQPFNFTMLTADTHFEDGYLSENTPLTYGDQYSNVIAYSDTLLGEFLTWVKEQPFYDNTVIVISGDHLSMDQDYFNHLDEGYQRTVFNLILNTDTKAERTNDRQFSTIDLFPTTLAALGIEIADNRLGLGTNLFSNQPTLIEQLGYSNINSELGKRSDYYNQHLMKNTNYKLNEEQRKRSYD